MYVYICIRTYIYTYFIYVILTVFIYGKWQKYSQTIPISVCLYLWNVTLAPLKSKGEICLLIP